MSEARTSISSLAELLGLEERSPNKDSDSNVPEDVQSSAQEAPTQTLQASNSEEFKAKLIAVKEKVVVKSEVLKSQAVALVRSPEFKTFTVVTAQGTVCFAAVGGAFGTASGVVVGAAIGTIPALLTFGLSIPAGAVIGGGTGMCVGTATGAGVGACTSYPLYRYRVGTKLKSGAERGIHCVKVTFDDTKSTAIAKAKETKAKTQECICFVKTKAGDVVCYTKTEAGRIATVTQVKTTQAIERVKAKSGEIATFATTTRPGVTGTAAAAGAVVGGTTGATVGTVAGAAVGVVPALFTFGLSIPLCAAAGFCTGAVAGSTTGAVGGAAAGYGGFTYRQQISDGTKGAFLKAKTKAKAISDGAEQAKAKAKESVMSLVGHTGGSEKLEKEG